MTDNCALTLAVGKVSCWYNSFPEIRYRHIRTGNLVLSASSYWFVCLDICGRKYLYFWSYVILQMALLYREYINECEFVKLLDFTISSHQTIHVIGCLQSVFRIVIKCLYNVLSQNNSLGGLNVCLYLPIRQQCSVCGIRVAYVWYRWSRIRNSGIQRLLILINKFSNLSKICRLFSYLLSRLVLARLASTIIIHY